jgi:hypothetical protein
MGANKTNNKQKFNVMSKQKETVGKESFEKAPPVIHERWIVSSRSLILVMSVMLLVAFQVLIVRPLEHRISHLESISGKTDSSVNNKFSLEQSITDTIAERKKENALNNKVTEAVDSLYTYDDFEW